MAIFSAIGGVIATSVFGLAAGTSAFAIASATIGGALAFGAKTLVNGYLNRRKSRNFSAVQGEVELGSNVPASTVFGNGKVKGHRIYYAKWGPGDKSNTDVFVLANGWCDGLEPYVYFYGEKHALYEIPPIGNEVKFYGVVGFENILSIRFYDGRPGQLADQRLVDFTANLGNPWKTTSVCTGLTYVIVERFYDERFGNGRPDIEFVLRGLREYDPRYDSTVSGGEGPQRLDDPSTWVHTQNPAVHRLNYQLGVRGRVSNRTIIGEGKSLGQLDLASYFASMNVCETPINGKPTYQASLIVTAEDDHTEVLKEFDDAMAGYGLNRRGLSGVIAGAPQIPVLEITADDIDMGRAKQIKRRKSAFELYNHISGQFTSIEDQWNPASLTPVYVNADIAADGRSRQTGNDFLQVTDPDIAQRVLAIRYRQQRLGGKYTVPVSRRVGLKVQEGQWVEIDGLEWLIVGWNCDAQFRFTLDLAETSASVYSEAGIEPGPIVVPSVPPINPSLISTVQNFNVIAGFEAGEDGLRVPALIFTWDPPEDPSITQVRFEYVIDPVGEIQRDAMDAPETGYYRTTKNVVSSEIYAARATITTVPDRVKTFTPWKLSAARTSDRIATVLNGAINELKLADRAVSSAKIQVAAVIQELIASNAVVASKIADLAITQQKVADNAISVAKIVNAAVTGDKLAPGSVAASKVVDGAIDAAKLANAAVTELKLADAAVAAAKIAAAAVLSSKLADNAVTVAKILDGAVTGSKILDEAVNAAKLSSGAVTETKISDGAISTPKLQANSVTTSKLVVTNSGVVVHPDPYMRDRSLWTAPSLSGGGGSYLFLENDVTAFHSNAVYALGQVINEYYGNRWPVDLEKDYLLTTRVRRTSGASTYYTGWVFFDGQGNRIDNVAMPGWPSANIGAGRYYAPSAANPPASYGTFSYVMGPNGQFQAPPGAKTMSFMVIANYLGGPTDVTRIGEINVSEMSRGELIVDGSIIANKIAAGAVVAGKIAANSITATQIAAGTITAAEIAAGAITASQLAASAVTAEKIAAGTITGEKIAGNTITGDKVVASTITTREIVVTGLGTAVNPDPSMQDEAYWKSPSFGLGSNVGFARNGVGSYYSNYLFISVPLFTEYARPEQQVPIDTAKTYLLSTVVRKVSGTGTYFTTFMFFDAQGNRITTTMSGWPSQNNPTGRYYAPANVTPPNAWTRYTHRMGPDGDFQAPPGAVSMAIGFVANNGGSGITYVGEIRVSEMSRGELIVDGGITADKIAANAVTATAIAAGSVVAGKIATNAVTTTTIAAGAVSANELAANSVIAAKIAAGAILAASLGASAVTADKLAANAVTADKIAANAVTAAKINVGSLAAISAVLGNVDISNANIGSLIVGESNIGFKSMTEPTAISNAGSWASGSGNRNYTTVATLNTAKLVGGFVQVDGSLTVSTNGATSSRATIQARIYRVDTAQEVWVSQQITLQGANSGPNSLNLPIVRDFAMDNSESPGSSGQYVLQISNTNMSGSATASWSLTGKLLLWKK